MLPCAYSAFDNDPFNVVALSHLTLKSSSGVKEQLAMSNVMSVEPPGIDGTESWTGAGAVVLRRMPMPLNADLSGAKKQLKVSEVHH